MLSRVINNFSRLISGNILASFISLFSVTYIANDLGIYEFGLFVICQSAYITLDKVFNIQGWQAIIRWGQDDYNYYSVYFYINIFLSLLALIVGCSVVLIIDSFFDISDLITPLFVYFLLIIFRNQDTAQAIIRKNNRYELLSLSAVFLSASRAILILLYDLDLIIVIKIFVITEIAYFLLINVVAYKISDINFIRFNFKDSLSLDMRSCLVSGAKINLTQVSDLPVSTMDSFIIAGFFGADTVGVYKLIRKYSSLLGRLVAPMNQVIFPEVSSLVRRHELKGAISFSKKMMLIYFFCLSIVSIVLFFLYEFFGKNFIAFDMGLYSVITIFLIEILALTFSVFGLMMIATEKAVMDAKFILFANVFYVLLLTVLPSDFGLYGIIFALSLQVLSLSLCRYLALRRVGF
ncbi:lipopolysaccharide biosynthesis protein [Vibrio sp. PID23_8]|uniref:lipopolysaccharide biosynthesis protein n=1 Tax=Vibrio sp. PID23_8 TaxID=1583767 RepID=UPI000E67D85B|nr:oligosaccharide flippase family protein [Vibrio sp. PID23_8]RIZ54463.1 hypothetical protein AK966_08530 [Vibrio sp. PID23_8]